eukprot:TRINITY_DN11626_c0_g1_i5.p1 TRINITY_DN11626_c0_g1~~TRINITY_DN11626_c0_g1_i5.p1  ORF type:complete len:783 (-),score=95.95 TRINITY_DN11626_c0_g1_i5:273-2621(-)
MTTVRTWLYQIGLQHLAPVFEESGYDDLEYLIEDSTNATGLTRAKMKAIGISRDAHLNKCIDELENLRSREHVAKSPKKSKVKTSGAAGNTVGYAGNRPKQIAAKASGKTPVAAPREAQRASSRIPSRTAGPLSDLSPEMQRKASKDFYTEEESPQIPIGTKLMVADPKGQWASARVVAHSDAGLTVQWTQKEWAKQTYVVPYNHGFSLSKCTSPTQANEAARKIREHILVVAHQERREAAHLVSMNRAEDLRKLEEERQQVAQLMVQREGNLMEVAKSTGVVPVQVVQPRQFDAADNDATVDQMVSELFRNEEEARALKIGERIVVADNKGQWAYAIVRGHSKDELKISWTGPWAKMKYQVRYDSEFQISKAASPEIANDGARRVRAQIRGLPHRACFQVIQCAVGCRVSCKSPRKVATGVYRNNGKVFCDCHKIEIAISDFALDCAQNNAKRPYECLEVETAHGVFSLAELRDVATGNTEVAVARQHMRNKRLLESVRGSSDDLDLARKATHVTNKDLDAARLNMTGIAPVPVHVRNAKKERARVPVKREQRPSVATTKKPRRAAKKEIEIEDANPTRSEWVQCENTGCNKWRRVTPKELSSLGSQPFLCQHNSDINYNCCSRKQEMTDEEIDRLLECGGDSSDEEPPPKRSMSAIKSPSSLQQDEFVSKRMIELKTSKPSLTQQQRLSLATEQWHVESQNPVDRRNKNTTSAGANPHEDLIGTKVLVPFKGASDKRIGEVGCWLPNKQKFDVCFEHEGGTSQWHLMSFAEVLCHKFSDF